MAGRLSLPDDVDVATFLLFDGKLNGKPLLASRFTLAALLEQCLVPS